VLKLIEHCAMKTYGGVEVSDQLHFLLCCPWNVGHVTVQADMLYSAPQFCYGFIKLESVIHHSLRTA
jgi:hypothetical protein